MAKRHGFEIGDYGLPISIRKRIDELIELNLNPSTINLLTSEFSNIDEDIRENIGRYIANLLEIETLVLEQHFEKIKEVNVFGNSKQELILKQRKTNLLRIQQIFASKDQKLNRIKNHNTLPIEEVKPASAINFKNAMLINGQALNDEEVAKEKLKELANKKRLIELAIFEEESKIKVAQKQYNEAKKNNDLTTQEIKLDLIEKSNTKLKKIDTAIKKYKTIDALPLEILLDDDQTIDFSRDEKKLREYLFNKDQIAFEKMQSDLKKLNDANHVSQDKQDDFFSVEGYEDFHFDDLEVLSVNDDELDPFELLMKQEQQIKEEEIKVKENENQQKIIKEENDLQQKEYIEGISKVKQLISEKEKNEKSKNLEINNLYSNINHKESKEKAKVNSGEKEISERIIQKIKKNSKAKDKKIEKIKKEKEIVLNELNSLKEKQKVEELRRIEISKRKAEKNTEVIIKKEKQKAEASYNLLERKWVGFRIKTTLFSKEKAINAIKLIRARAEEVERKKIDQTEDLIAYPEVEEATEIELEVENNIIIKENEEIIEPALIKESEKVSIIEDKNNNVHKFLEKKKNISREAKSMVDTDFDENKRIDFLERKKNLNIISKDELVELENKKAKQKNKEINLKVNLKKFILIKKNNF